MPQVFAAIGAVVGAISGAIASVGVAIGMSAAMAATVGSVVTGMILTAGLSLVSKLIHGSTGPPAARGSVTQINVQPDAPQPYVMGEGLVGGVLRHDTAYGATLNDVPNPYRWMAIVYSGAGPIDSITAYIDQGVISSYYSGYLTTTSQLGAQPESAALSPSFGAAPGWSSTSKLSGQAAIGWNFKFDRNGKVFASGIPQLGAYGKWVKVYDPRLDSTFPGGSGAHRLGTESTYAWSENPALHAGMYAYGRYQNGKRTIGCGLPSGAIDWANIAAWANVCDANSWRLFGIVTEPGDRWVNLKDIAAAGGGIPVISGGVLSFHYQSPRVSMATIAETDIADDAMSVTGMRSYRSRINTISPKFRDPNSNWELVNAADVIVSTYVTDDGESKKVEWPFNFVKDVNQAAQLARYVIEDSRELQPIEIVVGPHLRALRPGEAVDLDLPQMGLVTQAVILRREFDPMKMTVKLTLIGETTGKHAYALGMTGTAPPAPSLAMTGATRDDIVYGEGRAYVAATNQMPFSQFETGLLDWGETAHSAAIGSGLANGVDAAGYYLSETITATTSGQTVQLGALVAGNAFFAVLPAQRLAVQCTATATGPVNAAAGKIYWYDHSGSLLSSTTFNTITATPPNGRLQGFVTVPANAVLARVDVTFTTSAAGSGTVLIRQPQVSIASAPQSIYPLFVPGPNSLNGASNVILGFLTAPAATLAADSSGTVSSFTAANGTFKVYHGIIDITTSCTFSSVSQTGLTGTINASTGVYSVSALSASTGTFVMQAVYGSFTMQQTLTVSKAPAGSNGSAGAAGAAGAAGPALLIEPQNGDTFTYVNGVATPSSQTLNFIARLQGTSGTVTWTTSPSVTLTVSGTGNINAALTLANMGSNKTVLLTATCGAVSETMTIQLLADYTATAGAPGSSPVGSGGLTGNDVSNTINSGGGVATNQVVTASIVSSAVTNLSSAYTAGAATLTSATWTQIQSLGPITMTGASAAVKFGVNFAYYDTGFPYAQIRLKRDGTVISGAFSVPGFPVSIGKQFIFLGCICTTDTPSAASHTYTLEMLVQTGSGVQNCTDAYIEVLETKR